MDPSSPRLTDIIEDIVSNRLSRLEDLLIAAKDKQDCKLSALEATLLAMSGEQAARDAMKEKAAKARVKIERKERECEREELVEAIRRMALEEKEREGREEMPVVLKDCVGRRFVFPWEEGRGWQRFAELIRQAFEHINFLGPHVSDGHYDILDPNGRVILPSVWDAVVEPGWEVSMHMWPMNQDSIEDKRARFKRGDRNGRSLRQPFRPPYEDDREDYERQFGSGTRWRGGYDSDEDIVEIIEERDDEVEETIGENTRSRPRWRPGPCAIDESDLGNSIVSIPVFKKGPSVSKRRDSDPRIHQCGKTWCKKRSINAAEEVLVDDETYDWKIRYHAAQSELERLYRQIDEGKLRKRNDKSEVVIDHEATISPKGDTADGEGFEDWQEAVVED